MIEEIAIGITVGSTLVSIVYFVANQGIKIARLQDQHTALARTLGQFSKEKSENQALLQAQITQIVDRIDQLEKLLREIERQHRD